MKPVWNKQIAWYLRLNRECSVCSQKSRLATSRPHKFTSRKVVKRAERAFLVAKGPTERSRLVSLAVFSFAFRVSLCGSCSRFLSAKRRLEKVGEARSPQQTGAKMLRLGGRCEDLAHFPRLAKRKRKWLFCVKNGELRDFATGVPDYFFVSSWLEKGEKAGFFAIVNVFNTFSHVWTLTHTLARMTRLACNLTRIWGKISGRSRHINS